MTGMSAAQSQKTLQNKKDKLQKDIKYTNKLIKENKTKQTESVSVLEKINKNIENRSELIKTVEAEIRLIEKDITSNQSEVTRLESQLDLLKSQYRKLVYNAYKNRKSHIKWLYVLSAKSLQQSYSRIMYFREVGRNMEQQSGMILLTKNKKDEALNLLKADKTNKGVALNEQTKEAKALAEEKQKKEKLLSTLKSKESELNKEVAKKEKETLALTEKINKIISDEAAKRKKEAEKKATTSTNSTKTTTTTTVKKDPVPSETPESALVSTSFEGNKGKLPWPVEKGVITGKFGKQPHPVLPNIEIKNDGIDITTEDGASVRAIFAGEVSAVFAIDGYGTVVMIRHGRYLTVYSNLESVSVSKGSQVTAKQNIGKVNADNSTGKSWINFQVREDGSVLNPTTWISK